MGVANEPAARVIDIDGIRLHLGHADTTAGEWIGQAEVLKQLLACWLVVDARDLPLTPRLVGAPGIGKPPSASPPPASANKTSISTSARPTPGPKTCW